MMFERELQCAMDAAYAAGEKIMEIYNKDFIVTYKDDTSPVTEADFESNTIILEHLASMFPEDGMLSEEVIDDESRFDKKRFWVVDPLDGTKEFIKKNGEFAVNIGLIVEGKVVLGVVYLPVKKMIYYAVNGEGAYKKSLSEGKLTELHVSNREKPYHLLISRSHPSKRTQKFLSHNADVILSVTEMGSSIKGCLIAEGSYDVYYNFGLSMKWDTCAMECIVKEAGGILKRLDDHDIDYLERDKLNKGFYILNNWNNKMDLSKI